MLSIVTTLATVLTNITDLYNEPNTIFLPTDHNSIDAIIILLVNELVIMAEYTMQNDVEQIFIYIDKLLKKYNDKYILVSLNTIYPNILANIRITAE